jgi:DNA-binding transcriptional regulator LsrR (DeoR family)
MAALEVAPDADIMVVSDGTIDHRSGQYRTGYLDDGDLENIRARGHSGTSAARTSRATAPPCGSR